MLLLQTNERLVLVETLKESIETQMSEYLMRNSFLIRETLRDLCTHNLYLVEQQTFIAFVRVRFYNVEKTVSTFLDRLADVFKIAGKIENELVDFFVKSLVARLQALLKQLYSSSIELKMLSV